MQNGETPQRLAVLPAWRDVGLFSPTEQAALALAEAITTLPDHHAKERERTRARKHLTPDQFSAVSWVAITIERLQPDQHHQRTPGAPENGLTGRRRQAVQGRGNTVSTRTTWSRNSAM